MRTVLIIALVALSVAARAQESRSTEPRTNLEAFAGRSGTVVLKGYTSVGKIKGLGDVEITAMNFRSGGGSEESSGILLEVSEPRLSSDREAARSFIDYEEIAGLLDGIDHIRKANHSVTKLANFEAIYRTKGGVWITVYNATEGNWVAVQSGRIGGQTATLELEHLDQLRALIVRAKEILDDPQIRRKRKFWTIRRRCQRRPRLRRLKQFRRQLRRQLHPYRRPPSRHQRKGRRS